jgi:hypothetical protein
MSGIFPNVIDGAVVPSSAANAFTPTITPVNTTANYFSSSCNLKLRAELLNSLISEIACAVDSSGLAYNAASRCNLSLAIKKLITDNIPAVQTPVARATCALVAPVPAVTGDYWLNTGASPVDLYRFVSPSWVFQSPTAGPTIVVCDDCSNATMYVNCGSGYILANVGSSSGGGSGSTSFSLFNGPTTGAPFIVPAGVTALKFEGWGAGGGGGSGSTTEQTIGGRGGYAGYATGTIAVTPLETLIIRVGGGGVGPSIASSGGGGGGYSGIFRSATPLLIAGGGGGGGGARNSPGLDAGAGGFGGSFTVAGDGDDGPNNLADGGKGATAASGGATGTYNGGTPGSSYQGGIGGSSSFPSGVVGSGGLNGGGNGGQNTSSRGAGGGGGGGRFGGGGGSSGSNSPDESGAGGGGGISFVGSGVTLSNSQPGTNSNAGGNTNTNFLISYGQAGTGDVDSPTNGGDGAVRVSW